jgi:hypothetical protein
MKKIFTLILTATFALTASAQDDGFYRIKNTLTGRYLSIEDTNPYNYKVSVQSTSVNVAGIRTHADWDWVSTAPSTVVYLDKLDNGQYDIVGQGTSIYELSGNQLALDIIPQSDGSYKIQGTGTYSGTSMTVSLRDNEDGPDDDPDECFVFADSKPGKGGRGWSLIPVTTDDNYISIEANVKTDAGYWGSIYAGFPFELASEGMKAYYISSVSGDGFTLEEISGVIPAETPVIVKCTSNVPANNKIKPLTSGGAEIGENKLGGVYCSLNQVAHQNYTVYNSSIMRILGSSNGELAFVKAQESDLCEGMFIWGNRAVLVVPAGSPDTFVEGGTGITTINAQEAKSEGMYSLTGARIQEGSTPKAGIYIQNGKKVVIK